MTGPLRWTLGDVAETTAGQVVGDPATPVSSVTTDSRSVPEASLFVALRGDHFDGHAFTADAHAAGAGAVLVERPDGSGPCVVVADTGLALRDLAAARRHEIDVPVVAVTGSTGKTTTKDLLLAALPGAWGSPRSFNNEIGVPLTVLATPAAATHLVLEVGSRGGGHISWLGQAIRPDVAVITNLGVVHLETFGSLEALADAKWELIELLGPRGIAVLPADEEQLQRPGPGRVVRFGRDVGDVTVKDVTLDDVGRPSFKLVTRLGARAVTMPIAGRHQALNAAAATAAALEVGAGLDAIVAGLEHATASAWRMEVHPGRFTVVNDAYNANPQSVAGALETVAAMPGRHVAVLGEMAELGPVAAEEHARVGRLVRELGFISLVAVGSPYGLAAAAGDIAIEAEDADAAYDAVSATVDQGDVVLVKASRAVGLEHLAARLIEEARR